MSGHLQVPEHGPIQIVDFEEPDGESKNRLLKLDKENLQQILRLAGDRRIATIAIVGPSRKGKSFFLDFVIRYLEALEKDEADWMDWDNKDKPLVGFKWVTQIERETTGIVMWSKPFIVKANGKEIAVLLMDTQGTYDEYTTEKEMTSIVGMSLLLSSVLIFNFFNGIQEDVFTSLDTYIKYGQLALDGCNSAEGQGSDETIMTPFQKLLFLIRDWQMPVQYPFGSKGGKAYLDKKLELKDGLTECGFNVRKSLRECFTNLDCFLMPGQGTKATEEGFSGALSQLSNQFAKKLEELINDLMNPDELPLKAIFGTEMIASDLLNYTDQYVDVFNSSDTPAPLSLMEATARISNSNLVSKFTRQYLENLKKKQRGKQFLADSILKKSHTLAKKDALQAFQSIRKIGNKEMIESFEKELDEKIQDAFERIQNENKEKKRRLFDGAVEEAIKAYQDSMQEEFDNEDSFLEEKRLKSTSEQTQEAHLSELGEKLSDADEAEIESVKESLKQKLQGEQEKILMENKNRKLNAEKKMNELVENVCKLYKKDLEDFLEEDEFATEEKLSDHGIENKPTYVQRYEKSKKFGSVNFQKQFAKQLEDGLTKVFEEINKSHVIHLNEIMAKADESMDEILSEFETALQTELENWDKLEEESEVQKKKEMAGKEVEKLFIEKASIPLDCKLGIDAKLKNKFQIAFDSVVKLVIDSKKACKESYEKAVEDALSVFVEDLDGFCGIAGFRDDEQLEEKREELFKKAMTTYDAASKMGIHQTPDQFIQILETKIEENYKKKVQQNEERKELAVSKAETASHEAHNEYLSTMMKNLEIAKDADHFEELHEEAKKDAQDVLRKKVDVKSEEFLAPFLEILNDNIDSTFEDELKEVLELKLLERASGTANATAEARKLYREEMEKHYKNTEFMRPKDLEELHNKMSNLAIDKCLEKTPLSKIQLEELEAALTETYTRYKEENDMNVPVDPALGIDLGTTYSCVGVYLKGSVKIIPNPQGKTTTPSYVCYDDKGFPASVGIPAKEKAYENAENTIYDAKRIIGRKFEDSNLQNDMKFWPFKVVDDKQVPKVEINSKPFYPEQISSEILKEMRMTAEKYLNCTIENAVITVPAYFTDGQRQATIDAGELAGLKVLNIMTEPVAAAVAYKLQHNDDDARHILTFDLGGGTFDVAILKTSKCKIETLGVDGDTHLGGEDFDQNIMKYCALQFKSQHGIDLMDGKDSTVDKTRQEVRRRLKRLQLECERRKIELASCRSVDIGVDGIADGLDLKVTLTRDKFEELNEELFERTIEVVKKCLQDAGIDKSRVDDIVLVGGSTRIPKVQELLSDFFQGKALNRTINPDEAVAYGAAVQAAQMNGQIAQESKDFNTIQDVSPMSIGIEVYGGDFSVIIPKNTKIPVKFKEQYRTAHNNQTSVQITVYQGEADLAKNNNWLGEFYLNNIPPGDAGRETIDVIMEINLQGVLHVTAVCTSTGDKDSITVTEHKRRMGKEQIKRILGEAKAGGA